MRGEHSGNFPTAFRKFKKKKGIVFCSVEGYEKGVWPLRNDHALKIEGVVVLIRYFFRWPGQGPYYACVV